jgi:hypothetical protein
MDIFKTFLLLSLLAVFSSSCVLQAFAETSEVEARAFMDNVNIFLEKAYLSVGDAETAGANVTILKGRLVYAGQLLDAANASFRDGKFDDSVAFAQLANESLKGADQEASEAMTAARESRSQRFYWTVLESSIGISLVVFAVLVSWTYFKRSYVRRALGLKPEVRKNES